METGIATHRVLTRGVEWKNRPARVTRMLLGWRKSCAGHRVGTLAIRAGERPHDCDVHPGQKFDGRCRSGKSSQSGAPVRWC